MDLDLTDDQQLFLDTTRRFLAANWPLGLPRETAFDRDIPLDQVPHNEPYDACTRRF